MRPIEMCDLCKKSCVPCRGGVSTLTDEEVEALMPKVSAWKVAAVRGVKRIARSFTHEDFAGAMKFVNLVAELAEAEDHHPDIHIHWNRVQLELFTHKIKGLHENDFIMTAKIDKLFEGLGEGSR